MQGQQLTVFITEPSERLLETNAVKMIVGLVGRTRHREFTNMSSPDGGPGASNRHHRQTADERNGSIAPTT